MAKASERDRYKYGVCTNRDKDGKPCPKCESKEIQKIRMGQDFVCEECKEPMRQVPPPKPPTPRGMIIGIVVAALIILGTAVYFFVLPKKSSSVGEPGGRDTVIDSLSQDPGVKIIKIDSIVLDKESLVISVNETGILTATIFPTEAKKGNLKWTSKDSNVAAVENGVVTGLKAGDTSILVETEDGEYAATCLVTVAVAAPPPGGSEGGVYVGTINYPYGKYTGDIKDGKPHGNGTIEYTTSHKIVSDKDYVASPGDKITGSFREGRINLVTWYQKDGKSMAIK
ncbi:MAG: Ig-like domain-containing protein [Tannerellaceae bacterium]|jgi:uncharacterized protein YjdB|nr:Ig-like domain-containing protein [Tannerellaceae bacterium]